MNNTQLRLQQLRYSLLRTARELFSCQDFLRQIITQPSQTVPIYLAEANPLAGGDSAAPGGDASPDAPLPAMLLQQLMSAATQPSPVKAVFSKEELEVGVGQQRTKTKIKFFVFLQVKLI